MTLQLDENEIGIDSFAFDSTQSQKPTIQYGDGSIGSNSPILDSSSYPKYNQAVNGSLDWKKELNNLMSFKFDKARNFTQTPKDARNEASDKEKLRIKEQEVSSEFNRNDHFAIGTVYLSIPPTQISITEEKHNFRYKTLRNAAEIITTSGRSTTRIDLDITFNGIEEINTKLRSLIAQFKCTPFLPIENEYVKSVINPESRGLVGDLSRAKDTLATLNKKKAKVDSMKGLENSKMVSVLELKKSVTSMENSKLINHEQASRMRIMADKWYLEGDVSHVKRDPEANSSLINDGSGKSFLDFKGYVEKIITVPDSSYGNLEGKNSSINDIDTLSQNINSYEQQINTLFDENLEERFMDRVIVGVLAQMTISTMPGYPEALSCRISMHVFNYDPYVVNFGFVEGYDPSKYTPDITQCDLFIDWYSYRFLKEDRSKGSLGTYRVSNDMAMAYTSSINYDDLVNGTSPTIVADALVIEDETVVTGISVSMKNIVQFIPLLSGDTATCQYLGAYNTSVIININSKNMDKVREIRTMLSTVSRVSRVNNKLGRYCMFRISNAFTDLCGLRYVVLENSSIDTVPGNPGLYSINLEASEIKLGIEKCEQLDRFAIDSLDRIKDAAEYVLDRARDYMMDTSPNKWLTAGYRKYYNMVFGDNKDLSNTPLGRIIRSNSYRRSSAIFPDYYATPERLAEIKKINGPFITDATPAITDGEPPRISIFEGEIPWEREKISSENKLDIYIPNVKKCMSGEEAMYPDGTDMNWYTVKKFLVQAMAEENMGNLKFLLSEDIGSVDLKNWVFRNASTNFAGPQHGVDSTCYPDLGLPTYNDLGGRGEKFKLTYADLGMLTTTPTMRNTPAQTEWVSIEPDAFYSKMSVNNILNTFGTPGIKAGLKNFRDMATLNLKGYFSPYDPSKLTEDIEKSTSLNDDSHNVDTDSINKEEDMANNALSGKDCEIVNMVDGNTGWVKEKGNMFGKSFLVKFADITPKKSSEKVMPTNAATFFASLSMLRQPAMFQTVDINNTDVANRLFKGKTVSVNLIPNQHSVSDGKIILSAIGLFEDSNGDIRSMAEAVRTDGKMEMAYNSQSSADDLVNKTNSKAAEEDRKTMAETAILKKKNSGIPVKVPNNGSSSEGNNTSNTIERPTVKYTSDQLRDPFKAVTSGSGSTEKAGNQTSSTAVGQGGVPTTKEGSIQLAKDIAGEVIGSALSAGSTPSNNVGTAKSSVKGNEQEVLAVGVKAELAKIPDPENSTDTDSDGIHSNRYIYPASTEMFESLNFNKNATIKRFDRFSEIHMKGIEERIRNQVKDDKLRMVRAFPTFKFYFIEEDRMEYKPWPIIGETRNLDDVYSYNAIISIDINKSRKEAADTAVVQILNTKGVLDREKFGLHDPGSNFLNKGVEESPDRRTKETMDEQDVITEFILKVGTRIKIKMGYCSDPAFLDTVFTGMVSEVGTGDVITIIAQGYGVELLKPITGWGSRISTQTASAYKVLDTIIKRAEVMHFGFKEWQPIIGINNKVAGRRLVPKTATGPYTPEMYGYSHPSSWRTWLNKAFTVSRFNDPRNDNIYTPERSVLADEWNGDPMEFTCENRTVWDIFQEFTRRMPGYITQVLPFDNRATIYFGPSDGYYNYSNELRGLIGEMKSSMEDPESLFSYQKDSGQIKELSPEEKKNIIVRTNDIMNRVRWDDNWVLNKPALLNFTAKIPDEEYISWVLSSAEEYLGKTGQEEDKKVIEDFMKINDAGGGIYQDALVKRDKISYNLFNIEDEKIKNLTIYQDLQGRYYSKESYITKKWDENLRFPAHLQLIRKYHYVDSLKDIVSNSIVASDENMWNRVEVQTNSVIAHLLKQTRSAVLPFFSAPNPLRTMTIQVDDSIWKESLKTKVVHEPNATTILDAWEYAQGNLKLGVNEMYSGLLTILGDPTIKPHDVVFLNDYYTDMHGAFEVREVTHHFSHDTGFITTIVPDCICYANNSMAMASEALAGGHYDDYATSMLWVYKFTKIPLVGRITSKNAGPIIGAVTTAYFLNKLKLIPSASAGIPITKLITNSANGQRTGLGIVAGWLQRPWFIGSINKASDVANIATLGSSFAVDPLIKAAGASIARHPPAWIIGGALAFAEKFHGPELRNYEQACQFAVTGWTVGRREPINFLPLYYAGRPYIAGVKGMRRSDWLEPTAEGFQRFLFYTFNLAPRYMTQIIDTNVDENLSASLYQMEGKGSPGI